MPRRVPVLGIVTAADGTAGAAQSQLHPSVPRRQTFLAAERARRDRANGVQVAALMAHVGDPQCEEEAIVCADAPRAPRTTASASGVKPANSGDTACTSLAI